VYTNNSVKMLSPGRRRISLAIQGWHVRALLVGLSLLVGIGVAVTTVAADGAGPSPAAVPADAATSTATPRFAVMEYRVLGNTLLAPRDIESVLYPLLGENKQLSDVEAARAALEKLYHDRGFGTVFVDIPPQEVHEGIVRLRVTEATIHERKIDGARYFSERAITAALPASEVGTVPNLPELQQQLAAVNSQTPDRSVVPVLKAGPVPGTMDLELKVSDKLPLHGSLELNDYYTADTRPLRAIGALSYGNLFQDFDQVSLQYQDSPQAPGEVAVVNAGYTSRPFLNGETLAGYFIDSNSNVSEVGAGANGILGKGTIAGLRWSFLSLQLAGSSQGLTLGYDYKAFRNTITEGGGTSPLVTPIKYSELSVAYAGVWRWPTLDAALNATPTFGLRGLPNSAADFENDRYQARPDFFYLRWDGSLTLHPPAGYRVLFRVAGQNTNAPLISNESYSTGGIDGVRGYLEAEELGDSALKGTVQIQSPIVSRQATQLFDVFGFFDAGETHDYDVLAGQPDHVFLDSFGLGLNLLPTRPVNAVLIWADPLKDGSYTLAHQSRVLFSVRGAF
jgi:hemolysin activation/secretion protein